MEKKDYLPNDLKCLAFQMIHWIVKWICNCPQNIFYSLGMRVWSEISKIIQSTNLKKKVLFCSQPEALHVGIFTNVAFSLWFDLLSTDEHISWSLKPELWLTSFQVKDFQKVLFCCYYCMCSGKLFYFWLVYLFENVFCVQRLCNSTEMADMTNVVLVLCLLPGLFTCVWISVHLLSHYMTQIGCGQDFKVPLVCTGIFFL